MIGTLCTALLLVPPPTPDVPVISPELAFVYAGQDVVIEGEISQIGESKDRKTLFLNFGGRYPDHRFNAVIPEQSLALFPEARSWTGKVVRIRGGVQLYKGGMPETKSPD